MIMISGDVDAAITRAAQAVIDRIQAPQRRDAAYRDAVELGLSAIEVAALVRQRLVDVGVRPDVLARQGVSHDTVTRAVSSHRQ